MSCENALSYAPRGPVNVGKPWYHQNATSLTWVLLIPRIVAASTQGRVVRRRRLRATAIHNPEEDALEPRSDIAMTCPAMQRAG
jgi:hypothetical protein